MEKYIEENPTNPDSEDEKRVNERDTNKKKKNFGPFIAPEQVPNEKPFDPFDNHSTEEDSNDEDNFYSKAIKEEDENDTRNSIADKKKIEQLKQEIKFHQGDGAASLYTEELPTPKETQDHSSFFSSFSHKAKEEKEFENIEKENLPRVSRRKSNDPIASMSFQQVTRKSKGYINSVEKDNRQKASLKAHDNLKTIPENKKERSFRKKIADYLTKQIYGSTPAHDVENKIEETIPFEDENEVYLNGKKVDRRLLSDESEDRHDMVA